MSLAVIAVRARCFPSDWTQIDESIARYLSQLDSADRQGEAVPEAKITRLNEKIATLREEIQRLNGLNTLMMQSEDNIANRSRCALDGYKWPRQRDGRLQCAKCGRYEAPSHCYP